VVTSHCAYSKI